MRIILAQLNLLVGDIQGNLAKMIASAIEARDQLQATAIVFSELSLTAYPPDDLLLRADFIAASDAALQALQQQVHGIYLIVGHPFQQAEALFNRVSVLHDGALIATYDKHLLPNYGVFDEKRYFTPGKEFCIFDMNGIATGICICEDAWQQGVVEQTVALGAQQMLILNASPYYMSKRSRRDEVMQQRVANTRVPILYCNQVGGQDELVFDGASFAMDQHGQIVQRAAVFEETLLLIDIQRSAGNLCLQKAPLVALPSIEAIVYKGLVMGVRDYVRKNGFSGVVLGLSGGIDSAFTLALAVDALGAEQVEAVMMPYRYTSDMSQHDARLQAGLLGVHYHVIPIESVVGSFLTLLDERFTGLSADTTEENLQARCRGVILMAISNKSGKLLLTTGNKSEMSVGYATLYGDMAGGFAPLKDVYKTLVYSLSRYRNACGDGEIIPERVITRPPSAELAPDQKDEDSLPPYDVLDAILRLFIEEFQSVDDIVAQGFELETVKRTANLLLLNEYKRRQSAPGVRITQRAFGKDRRYPITSAYRRYL
jgi:NAD+ synthase (glutamine-hydrolysing)